MQSNPKQAGNSPTLLRFFDLTLPVTSLFLLEYFITDFDWQLVNSLLGVGAGLLVFLITQIKGGYDNYFEKTLAQQLKLVFQTWYLSVLILVFLAFVTATPMEIARRVTLLWVFFTPIVIFILKYYFTHFQNKASGTLIHVALIGQSYTFNESERNYLKSRNIDIEYIPLTIDLSEHHSSNQTPDIYILNTSSQLDTELVKQLSRLELEQGIHVMTMQFFFESYLRKCFVGFSEAEITYFHDIKPLRFDQFLLKRTFDYSLAFFLIMASLPLLPYIIWRIRKESPGSIFFTQLREGIHAKDFTLVKFRSMHSDAEKSGEQYASQDDPRAFEFGKFMRKTRLDELPQLWNVLKSDLHLIGPRPERRFFAEQLETQIPYFNERHLIRPGISGWAQVMYPYGANSEDSRQKLMYDLYYIKHWSIWLDLEILIRTIKVIIAQKGA